MHLGFKFVKRIKHIKKKIEKIPLGIKTINVFFVKSQILGCGFLDAMTSAQEIRI